MWQRFNNCVSSLVTYGTLSPDFMLRMQINCALRSRLPLNKEDWLTYYGHHDQISKEIINFAYRHLPLYSGLAVSRLRPDDCLETDLHWTQVCWFDWDIELYSNFFDCFGKDISMTFDVARTRTVADFLRSLEQHRS